MPIEQVSLHMQPPALDEPSATARPKNLQQASQQFEGMLIAQLLRMARSEESGWLGSGEDPAAATALEFAEESLAQSIAASGGFGLAKTQFAMLTQDKK